MLLKLQPQHRMAVLEMGMNHLGEIDYLSRLVVPDVSLIIMAGTAHIGELGSREAIAKAKGELFFGLRDDGVACINIDDTFSRYWHGVVEQDNRRRVITFGIDRNAMVRGVLQCNGSNGIEVTIAGESRHITLAVMGEHNQRNAIAAAAGAYAVGVPLATIAEGLASFSGVDGRLRHYVGLNDAAVIDDTYNANPDSMRAAIDCAGSNLRAKKY
ncbi:MAG: hypothetical protein HC782_03090 [Gammaproteobacteria bacterium]|nr:hypothetical protein [Gammaproteobacteria bacterium]